MTASIYILGAHCAELKRMVMASENVSNALTVMKTGALLAKDERVVAEIEAMIEALDMVGKKVAEAADALDPRMDGQ